MRNMTKEIMRIPRQGGGELLERWENGCWYMELSQAGGRERLGMYAPGDLGRKEERLLWGGKNAEDLLDSGRDILGEERMGRGEPDYGEISRLLPPITKGAYCFLSGAASWGGVTVDPMGQIFPQVSGNLRQPDPIFSPVQIDGVLGEMRPCQFLLAGQYPLLFSVHRDGEEILEFLYFVEPQDPDRDPIVWIRSKRYRVSAPEECRIEYRIAALSRHTGRMMEEETFLTALADTVSYWVKFCRSGARLSLPQKELQRAVYGTLMACAATFSGDHAHYGHLRYGAELHDNFPPNYIWSLKACCLLGHQSWGQRIFQHMMLYVLNDEGRFTYRQGEHELFGASAEEYGQLLFVIRRYSRLLEAERWPEEYWEKLLGMGDVLLANSVPCGEYGGLTLVRMCAEADTNTRVHVYLNNNLWAIRGLRALSGLLEENGREAAAMPYSDMAATLLSNVRTLTERQAQDTVYGPLVSFRLGYPCLPYTLSTCRKAPASLNPEEIRKYFTVSDARSQDEGQDLTENTYANYRYYLEMLSAMLLTEDQARAIVKMREDLGGEYLGMTRFYRWLDDWPVIHYARYLLETGDTSKYLMLLYAHTAHHGNPELMCYYEQVSTEGEVLAPDCVPSLLTTAVMTAWMFAYERVEDGTLLLLAGVPLAWFASTFEAERIGFSGGNVSMYWDGCCLRIAFSEPLEKEACLVWRRVQKLEAGDFEEGFDAVERIEGNRIFLKRGIRETVFRFYSE